MAFLKFAIVFYLIFLTDLCILDVCGEGLQRRVCELDEDNLLVVCILRIFEAQTSRSSVTRQDGHIHESLLKSQSRHC
jgi:hypothetical protein